MPKVMYPHIGVVHLSQVPIELVVDRSDVGGLAMTTNVREDAIEARVPFPPGSEPEFIDIRLLLAQLCNDERRHIQRPAALGCLEWYCFPLTRLVQLPLTPD